MKYAYAAFLAAVAAMPLMSAAAPMRRDDAGVTCNKKFEGKLYVTNLYGGKGSTVGDPFDLVSQTTDGTNRLTDSNADPQSVVSFQFDECYTDGWNVDGQLLGQLKSVPQDDSHPTCVTAVAPADDPAGPGVLTIKDCSAYNGGDLNQQWFKATQGSNALGDFVQLQLNGNPNDEDYTSQKPMAVSVENIVQVHALDSPVLISLALFNVTQLSS